MTRKTVEQLWSDEPRHPTAGVEHETKRMDQRWVDERQHVIDVVVEDHRFGPSSMCRVGRYSMLSDEVADVRETGFSA